MKKTIIVTSVALSFRRAGMTFTRQETRLPVETLTEDVVKALKAEKNLVVRESEQVEDTNASSQSEQASDQQHAETKQKALADLIADLDKADSDLWTGDGKPQIKTLEAMLGDKVSAAERDAALDLLASTANE
ncbi:HI1506-related protein [Thiomicrorhabdus sp. Kp2]|uniref:HI1506-related protein n=1 Tax=Thiomicrorhabdus sp. Kp2 TaxID=1123518 RepID=UPI00041C5147|nr:HI1506-related protein [Thiomicrorhabdus sp. Kp2]